MNGCPLIRVMQVIIRLDLAMRMSQIPGCYYRRGVEVLAALTLATAEFERRLALVTPSRWQDPTPCEEWTVRDIADHITGGNRFAVLILGGASVDDAMRQVRSGNFSDDPMTAFHDSASAQIDAFSRPGAMVDLCHHPVGQIPGQQFAGLRVGDLVVHAWDIARAVGADENLDEELVREAFTVYEPMAEGFLDSGAFGSGPRFAADDLSPQSRLLHLLGRRP
jgi:uncharacterized protein (TIGR03086 family)